jgi:hypothetical protein
VFHTLSEEVGLGLSSTLLPPAKAPKRPSKPSHSHQDEMMCHRRFRVLSACRRRSVLDPLCLHIRMKTVEKLLNRFLLLHLNTKMKAKTVKLDTKTNMNLRNIENFKNEPIQAKLCRTRSVYENLIRNTNTQCITINKCYGGKF